MEIATRIKLEMEHLEALHKNYLYSSGSTDAFKDLIAAYFRIGFQCHCQSMSDALNQLGIYSAHRYLLPHYEVGREHKHKIVEATQDEGWFDRLLEELKSAFNEFVSDSKLENKSEIQSRLNWLAYNIGLIGPISIDLNDLPIGVVQYISDAFYRGKRLRMSLETAGAAAYNVNKHAESITNESVQHWIAKHKVSG